MSVALGLDSIANSQDILCALSSVAAIDCDDSPVNRLTHSLVYTSAEVFILPLTID